MLTTNGFGFVTAEHLFKILIFLKLAFAVSRSPPPASRRHPKLVAHAGGGACVQYVYTVCLKKKSLFLKFVHFTSELL